MARIKVEVTGDFLVDSSLARVNRGLFGALARRDDIELRILPEPSAAVIAGNRDDELLEASRRTRFSEGPDVTIRHRWPPVFPRIAQGAYVHMQPWEFGNIPLHWAQELREIADDVWCYSRYVAAMYLRAGMAADRVHVVPLGFDPATYAPGPPPPSSGLGGRCVFLYVGDTIARKGVDVVVDAYCRAFTPADQVVLVVKDFGAKAPGETELRDRVAGLANRRDIPPVVYLDSTFSDEALAGLYRSATALVSPYRGEGFGLPVLEAMACGTVPIVTRGGATDDFTTSETAILIDAQRADLGRSYRGFELTADAFWLEPSLEGVVAAMRDVFERPERARELGRRAAEHAAAGWTWAQGAQRAAERLHELAAREPLAKGRPSAGAGEFNRFELRIASRGGEDGVLLELFRRMGVADPFFVELVPSGEDPVTTVYLARALGWRGIVIQGDAPVYADLATRLDEYNVPKDFELLALGPGGRAGWERLGAYRPKVVVALLDGSVPPDDIARSSGYVPIGVESGGASAFFVRTDLLSQTRFAPIAS